MSEEGKGFVIKDKRRFDADGKEREGAASAEEAKSDSSAATVETSEASFEMKEEHAQAKSPEIDFSSFVMSLATQALIQLGEMSPPSGLDLPVDKVAAKQTIDILEMLRVKTEGNLEDAEDRLLEEILHNLRMSYVKV